MPEHDRTSRNPLCTIIRSQINLDKSCISLVVQNLDPGNGAKLLKRVEERIRVGKIWRDVGYKENNL